MPLIRNLLLELNRPRFWWVLTACWVAGVFGVSCLNSVPMPQIKGPFEVDRVLHAMAYSIGGLLVCTALYFQWPWKRWPAIMGWTVLILGLYGLTDEIHQSFVPGRSGNDFGDLVADVIGAIIGAILCRIIYAGHRTSQSAG